MVEAAVPQEGRIEGGHVVRRADEQPPVLRPEPDDCLERFVDGADHHLVRRGHHRRVEGLKGRHGVREREGRWLFGRTALRVDAEHRFEIVLGVVPDMPPRHHQLHVFGRTSVTSRCTQDACDRRRP